MIKNIDAKINFEAIRNAAVGYADYVTDRDPGDGEHVVPGELRRFLARLRLLHGVPFSYLVPDATLLPVESIRFFYVDRAWTDALTQGALSVGTTSTTDRTQLEAVYPHIQQEVDEAERTIRQPRQSNKEELLKGPGGTVTGFLLRSRAVSGWPNLHVRAYSVDKLADDALTNLAESDPNRMKVLRMERLAPAVLLVLFDGVPAVVHIEEPRQGLQFGVRLDPDDPIPTAPGTFRLKVKLRDNNTGLPVPPKKNFTNKNSVQVPFRNGAPGVIDIAALRKKLQDHEGTKCPDMQPNAFALQMLRFPFRQVFGDPDNNKPEVRFYDANKHFKVELAMPLWEQTVKDSLKGLKP